jgi:hypothetical protein
MTLQIFMGVGCPEFFLVPTMSTAVVSRAVREVGVSEGTA